MVLVAASPIAIAAVSLIGDTWHPVGAWASMLDRTSRVGTTETPLVGAYTVKGWAHPGPFLYWAAAPLYRLTGGDARSLEWTAAILNVATVGAIGAVAWRRGRFALLAARMLLVAVLVRGIEPGRLVDLWNPYVGLLPFLWWCCSRGTPPSAVPARCSGPRSRRRSPSRATSRSRYAGSWRDAYASCLEDPDVELVASYDQLDPAERDELGRPKDGSFFSPDTYSADDEARTEELVEASFRAGVFAGEHGCGDEEEDEEEETSRAG